MFASAQASFDGGNYSKAVIELKQILQNDAKNVDARKLLARTYLKKGDGVSAEKEITNVSAAMPPGADIQAILLASLKLQGKHKEIIEKYEKGEFGDMESSSLWGVVAYSYLSEKETEKGTALARKLLDKDPNSVAALLSLAKAASARNDDAEAVELLRRAQKIDKEDYRVWRDLSVEHAKLEDFSKAVEYLQTALSLIRPGDPAQDAYAIKVSLVQLLFQQGRLDEGEAYIKELEAKYRKIPYVAYLSGLHSYLKQNYETAVIKLTEAHAAMPNHLPTILLLGALQFNENNLEQANILLTRYVNQVPTHLVARKLLGEIKLRLDKPKEALALLESGGVENSDTQMLKMIGLAASQSGEYSKGIDILKKAADANPNDTRIREELARLYINHGAVDDAITELEEKWVGDSSKRDTLLIISYIKKQDLVSARKLSDQILQRGSGRPEDLYLRAYLELNSGNRNKAKSYLIDAIGKNSEFVPGQLALARMDLEDGQLAASSDRLNLVLAKEPQNVTAMMLLAQISERSGKQDEALHWLEKAVESGDKTWLPRLILARYYLRRQEPEKAAIYLDDKNLRESNNPAIISILAMVAKQSGHYSEAESSIKKLITENPKSEIAYLQLADLQSKRGDLDAARTTLQKLDSEIPSSIKGKLMRFKLEMESNNHQQAEKIVKQLLDNDKTRFVGVRLQANYHEATGNRQKAIESLEAHVSSQTPFAIIQQLSNLYTKNKDYERAIELLSDWIKSHNNDQQGQLALAIVYQSMGKDKAAVDIYDELLEANPKNLVALNNSALLVFDHAPQKALEQAKKAYAISGNSSHAVVDTYAWLTHRLGDTAAALKLLSPIVESSSDPSILYHYAVMLVESGRAAEAEKVLVSIIEGHQQFPESEEVQKLLSEISQFKG